MQARNHENSDEFRPTPLRHLDLDTPAFYYYRKNPKCYHTVWGKTCQRHSNVNLVFFSYYTFLESAHICICPDSCLAIAQTPDQFAHLLGPLSKENCHPSFIITKHPANYIRTLTLLSKFGSHWKQNKKSHQP